MSDGRPKRKKVIIGDIHGYQSALVGLLGHYSSQLDDIHVIFLGDYVDRGPDSSGVIQTIIKQVPHKTCLVGNHEELFCGFLKGNDDSLPDEGMPEGHIKAWLTPNNGGKATLDSYGFGTGMTWSDLPRSHRDFLSGLDLYYEDEDVICVHAGIDVDIKDMSEQDRDYVIWTRARWLEDRKRYTGKPVVYGHTITHNFPTLTNSYGLLATESTLGIDTGAYHTGVITAVECDDSGLGTVVQFNHKTKKITTGNLN